MSRAVVKGGVFPDRDSLHMDLEGTLVSLLYQKGKHSRIFQVQDRAIDDFTVMLKDDASPAKLLLLTEQAGTGKTTVLRRVAFELAKRGVRTLLCSALSRIDRATSSVLDLIGDPVVIVVDNFADQVTAVSEMLSQLERRDVLVLAAERGYRLGYLKTVLSETAYTVVDDISLSEIEVERLIDKYFEQGHIGDHNILRYKKTYARRLSPDPIAVACCRIMKNFKPLERIVDEIVKDVSEFELNRYICSALAQHCFMGGVRHSILTGAVDAKGIDKQIDYDNPLPLTYYDSGKNYVIPENSTLAERVLARTVREDKGRLLDIFIALANEIQPFVNRETIKRRAPEARLAGRLFDFDDVAGKLLGDDADCFYSSTRDQWRWNSRYWEQVSLLSLSKYYRAPDAPDARDHLETAVQHARHAVAIEFHPFGLTTLGKVLINVPDAGPRVFDGIDL
jgi:hypothetical protein